MSGHSKWHNIQMKKGKTDAARGKIFTKIGREIAIAVRAGGPDPALNSKLRDIISKAKYNNMPNDNINRSIKKAAGEGQGENYKEVTYEGYGPAGTAIIVECITDNLNRTASDVRHCFEKHGGSMGATGCVSWMFDRKGVILIEAEGLDEDEVMMDALEAGAADCALNDGVFEITTEPNDLDAVRTALEGKYTLVSAEVSMIPQNKITLDEANLVKFNKLVICSRISTTCRTSTTTSNCPKRTKRRKKAKRGGSASFFCGGRRL